MDLTQRITQFENMAQADPSNEMAHFSLGKAYSEAGRFQDAADSFQRCTQLVPDMSKAYQMAGEMLIKAGKAERAGDMLEEGVKVAAERGDLMPKNAMIALLKQIGRAVPEVANVAASAAGAAGGLAVAIDPNNVPPGMMVCRQSGRLGTKMGRPPFKGPVGEWISAHISAETFKLWIAQGTKVINELRLDLSRDKDQEIYDQHMREFLGVEEGVR